MELTLRNSNLTTIINDEDYEKVVDIKWYIGKSGYVYGVFGKQIKIYLHRFLLNIADKKIQIDHKDHNRLNNSRDNLRICNNQKNSFNKKKKNNSTSIYKGVSWNKKYNKWRSCLMFNSKQYHGGFFEKEIDAAYAYDFLAIKYFKEYAFLNFPNKDYSNFVDTIKRKND